MPTHGHVVHEFLTLEHIMTDTNTTPTPATPAAERHATKLETVTLFTDILNIINAHIESVAERRVDAILESHAAMKIIDESVEKKLREIAQEMIDEHESDFEHHSTDDISDTVATHINHHDWGHLVKRSVEEIMSDGDYATEERVQEMIDDHDFEESVKEVLRNI